MVCELSPKIQSMEGKTQNLGATTVGCCGTIQRARITCCGPDHYISQHDYNASQACAGTHIHAHKSKGGEQTFLSASSLDKLSAVQTAFTPVKYFLLMSLSILNAFQIYMY